MREAKLSFKVDYLTEGQLFILGKKTIRKSIRNKIDDK